MSRHTIQYLNGGNILVGNGHKAWWYKQQLEDPSNPTHYDGPIPVGDVQRRLFGWSALESTRLMATVRFPDGSTREIDCSENFKALIREDTETCIHVHGADYSVHQFGKTLLDTTSNIIGDTLVIDSAGLLRFGAVGWVQVSITQDMHNDESGFAFRPKLLGSTSFDGSMATTWKRVCQFVVCDNTFDMAMLESSAGIFRRRHTRNSLDNIVTDARSALGLIDRAADAMDDAINDLIRTEVSELQFSHWLDRMVPIPEIRAGMPTNGRSLAENKRDTLTTMWTSDPRVAPWRGTKFGVLQLANTFSQHESIVRGANRFDGNALQARVERNMLNVLGNEQAKRDSAAMQALDRVLEMAA